MDSNQAIFNPNNEAAPPNNPKINST